MSGLTLGGIYLDGFEIPGGLRFGGRQALNVHRLPGGTRIVDAMGRDDAPVAWSGVLSGSGAADRGRALDLMRVSGAAIPLSWDAFFYLVVIQRLEMSYANPWWIPYVISCTVLTDGSQLAAQAALSLSASVAADLAVAANYTDVSAASAAVAAAGNLTAGTASYANAGVALQGATDGITTGINQAELGLAGSDLGGVASAAGSLAQLSLAQGYVGRALANFNLASD